MKSCAVGVWMLSHLAWSLPERRAWRLEQLTLPPLPAAEAQVRNQYSLQVGNYADSLSLQMSGLLDLGAVEFEAKGSELLFPRLTETGQVFYDEHRPENMAVELSLGRHFVTSKKHYGRLGVGGLRMLPNGLTWLHVSTSTGILPSADVPWELHLHVDYYKTLSRDSNMIVASGESLRLVTETPSRWQLGGGIFWSYRLRELTDTTGQVFEHMYLSFAPIVEYVTPSSRFKVSFPWRIWLDYTQYQIPSPGDPTRQITISSYPTEIRLPDIQIQFSQLL